MPLRHRRSSVLALLFLASCGGSVRSEADPDPGPNLDAGDDALDGATSSDGDVVVRDSGRADAPNEYVEPDCPDAPPDPPYVECDALAEPGFSGCAGGEACYPFVIYPQTECGQETYGARCVPAGTGKQGSPCGEGENGCAAGFVCVISGAGTQCVKLCDIDRIGSCESGLVCSPVDIPGYGGCL